MTDDLAETTARSLPDSTKQNGALPGQIVLVFQGGGALGAYQGGVYEALHEAGIAPDWVIGTSIGAINGAIIAGNEPGYRLEALREFWNRMERKSPWHDA
jgi:NTE family protein